MRGKWVRDLLTLLGIAFLVEYAWSIIEIMITGEIVVSKVDTLVSFVLISSLFMNLKMSERLKELKKESKRAIAKLRDK